MLADHARDILFHRGMPPRRRFSHVIFVVQSGNVAVDFNTQVGTTQSRMEECMARLQACNRAAKLGVVNLILVCATPHLVVLTNTLGMQWRTICTFHGVVGVLTALLLFCHTIAFALSRNSFTLARTEFFWATVAAASTIRLFQSDFLPPKSLVQDIFRAHRSLAILSLCGISISTASPVQALRGRI
ncbi:uncharacterized protein F5Z01DRAFT_349625 [Emericellopsis atlantica]|uniref:Uncharacterized protein n=1 Tax=Emericellopsis atlantica TaxID=2614577 RepID=A0A9P7ZEF6_9HYPO|nr:uncharacterized protein F5Z01DRAFT_349625 [Emericellopsis atlantica]KAG9250628.1 hypothetical protein F5Z01DRAFT_349625 [Emericellopsis atlantica]